jgi:subtilase family serine protease
MNISIASTPSFNLHTPFNLVGISGTVTNQSSQDMSGLDLQSWITQGAATIGAGGAVLLSSNPVPGVVGALSTVVLNSFHSANASLGIPAGVVPGTATLTVQLRQSVGGTTIIWDSKTFPITLVN